MYNYFVSNPCYYSSLVLPLNIPLTIYYNNHVYLLTEIPISITTVLYHNEYKCIKHIRIIDIAVGQVAFWQHMYYATIYENNFAIICYLICPAIFLLSKYYCLQFFLFHIYFHVNYYDLLCHH